MKKFQQSSLWLRTLAIQSRSDKFSNERKFLREELEKFRGKAAVLAKEISITLPEYTVHDINHIDALWDMAGLIVPKTFDINPAEAFVLGGAFLLHDLGMALAAYPKGIDELKKEQIWMDTFWSLRKETESNPIKDKNIDINLIEQCATERTLRFLHAERASELAHISWKNSTGEDMFLLDNEVLRSAFGNIIGLIARSHWLRTDELEDALPPSKGALSEFPKDWTIDPLKLACVLRIADAIQIDDRRAPSFLKALRQLPASSQHHWIFQQKLLQPRVEHNRVVFTSKSPFKINEVDSWWLCCDTLKMIDNELRLVDGLLTKKYAQSFNLLGIASIENVKDLSKFIAVEGWEPIDVKIRVDNVAKLVSNIGGKQLYGNNVIVPLREMIQNASDAIRARRLMENENDLYGDVYIRIGNDEKGRYIEVEDNGIGMSEKVLTGPLLDFGQSFWGTDLMHEELPGLETKGYKSTGKYGIGFFSLLMWGEKISIFTNSYTRSRKDTLVLELNSGATSRPILRKASAEEVIRNGGTRIKVWVGDNIINEILYSKSYHNKNKKASLSEVIEALCPSIDCNIIIKDKSKHSTVIKANDWITISQDRFLKRVIGQELYKRLKSEHKNFYDLLLTNISVIKDGDNKVVGRAALFCDVNRIINSFEGTVTVGGLKTTRLSGLVGIFAGKPERASRDIGIPIIQNHDLTKWVEKQIHALENQNIAHTQQAEIAAICRAIIEKTGKLKIAGHNSGYMSYVEIIEYVKKNNFDHYILVQDAKVSLYERGEHLKIKYDKNVFWMSCGIPGILQADPFILWPECDKRIQKRFDNATLKGLVIEAISEAWNIRLDDLYDTSCFSDDNNSFSARVGMVNKKEIVMDHVCIISKDRREIN